MSTFTQSYSPIIINEEIRTSIERIIQLSVDFLEKHAVSPLTEEAYAGDFSLHTSRTEADLYGMVDAVYILYILGLLPKRTTRESRAIWANQILDCQDECGWFSQKNKRGHSPEHATAYALGALKLLAVEPQEDYLQKLKPLQFLQPILADYNTFLDWIEHLGFEYKLRNIVEKKVGWNHIWRSSHIGGGIPAALYMTGHLHHEWWPDEVNRQQWFEWYFQWLNAEVNPNTGYWQRALWNLLYRKPTLIDMGGAVHFFWIYEALGQPLPYPEQIIQSTLTLQKATGLYKTHPFCIDLDGNFCISRSYLQLPKAIQSTYETVVYNALEANFRAIVQMLTQNPLTEIYSDLHGLPGALAALIECTKLPDFLYTPYLVGWKNPFDRVCWL
ncbi:MAG: hypothetical protein R3E79_55750 [Caldilineaceae bacterium]